jgi:hypothetical protein
MVLIRDLKVVTIPQQLIDANARFVLVKPKSKRAMETGWEVGMNYSYGDKELMDHLDNRGNYGVLSWNGLCMFDVDNAEKAVGTDFKLPKTFTIKRADPTGNHHRHVYFFCPDCPEKMKDKHILTFGDVRLGGNFYVVGPNCHHPDGIDYEVEYDYPIANISWEIVSKILDKFEIVSDNPVPPASRGNYPPVGDWTEILGLRCIDILPPKGKVSIVGDIVKGDHPLHGSKNGQNFHINTRSNEWKCWRCDHGGTAISLYAMKKGLITCEQYQPGCLVGKGEKLILALDADGYDVKKLGTFAEIVLIGKDTKEFLKKWGV